MRCTSVSLAVVLLTSVAGCNTAVPTTQPAPTNIATASPSSDELPVYEFGEDVLPARIGVDDHNPAPVRQLVILDPELPLTPEEEKALGIKKPLYDPLELYRPGPSADTPQLPFDYRLETYIYGLGGSGARPFSPPSAGAATAGTASRGQTWSMFPSHVTGIYPASTSISGQGERGGVDISEGSRSSTGSRHERSKP